MPSLHIPDALPAPDADAQAHSERVQTLIREQIEAAGGMISFARFMELALYAPGLGYYTAGARKFGAAGDFITAPELSVLFSRCLARQVRELLEALGEGDVLEFGAGSGAMAAEVLAELERLEMLPERYLVMEISAELRERQRETLHARVPHIVERVEWIDTLPERFTGVVLANEVLDAMPVHRFRVGHDGVEEACVTTGDSGFEWVYAAPQDLELAAALERLQSSVPESLPPGYASEINMAAPAWTNTVASMLERGAALLIDYGYPRAEYYHPHRSTGTLVCHYRHRRHDDPLLLAGLQDITAHVDFTAIAEAAVQAGLSVSGYTTQGSFLLATGLTDFAAASDPHDLQAHLELTRQIKMLTLPGEMGELFKVMALTRDVDIPLMGFDLRDDRGRL